MSGYGDLSSLDSARVASRYINDRCFGLDPLVTLYSPCGRYGNALYGGYGFYGYNTYGSGYYYPGYNYGSYGGYYRGFYGAPVVVVKGDQQQVSHGRLVKGEGYTPGPGSSSSGSTASHPSGSSSSSGSSGSSGSTGSTSGGSSSSGSTSSGGGRTAIPRPPT